jgi:hypothetical protein
MLLFYYSYYHYFTLIIGCVCIYYIYSNTSIDKYLLVIYGFVRLKYSTWCHIEGKATNYQRDITSQAMSASNLDLHLEIDSESRLRTKHYDKRDDFNFPIVDFPFTVYI